MVPSTSGVLGDTGIPKSYPGFYELREGMAIQHMTGGPFCGGWSSPPLVNSLRKLVEKINFYEKSNEPEIVSYLYNEQAFKNAILSGVNEETTIYTLVAVFNNTMTKDHAILQRMIEKSEHYTSFVQFLEDFKKRKFPEFKLLIVREAELCRQRQNDSFSRYAQKWEIMARQAKWDLEERLPHFISGMFNKDTQNKCNSIALGERTFDRVRDYAAEYEQRRSESELSRARREADAEVEKRMRNKTHTSSVSTNSQAKRDRPQSSKTKPSGSGGTSRDDQQTHPKSVASTSTAESKLRSGISKAKAKIMALKIKGCYSCLGYHNFNDSFDQCAKECVFCKKKFHHENQRHLAMLCDKKPETATDLYRVLNLWRDGTNKRK